MVLEKGEEIPSELEESEMKVPRYAGRVKAVVAKGASRNVPPEYEIGVWIDTYDDIFSDFDSRPFLQRALSDDFLLEMKRASRDKPSGATELKILAPAKIRSFAVEAMIRKRLKEHFRKHYLRIENEIREIKRRGLKMILGGMFMIGIATYLLSLDVKSLWKNFLVVIFEPGGWFLGWTGLDQFFYSINEKKPDLEFYEKMANAEIEFASY